VEDAKKGKLEYKFYVFFDDEKAPDNLKKALKSTFGPEKGWEG
jgi:hypothetical protein